MAESIVKVVLGKLAEVALKEVLLVYNIDKQVETVSRELSRIQAFLKNADKKRITNESQKHWLKEVRELAYSIEDVIDTFLIEVVHEEQELQESDMVARADATNVQHVLTHFSCCLPLIEDVINNMTKKTKNLPAAYKLKEEINQIQIRMKEIQASRVSYGINNLGEGSGEIRLPIKPLVLPNVDPDIIGFKADMDHLVKKLFDETTKRRSVVSIWGPGGLGKTTLALKLYNCNDSKRKFGLRIWVDISQKFEVIDILKKIAPQLQPPIKCSKQPDVILLSEIQNSLYGKKYLIVLNDVWTSDLWLQIGAAFPNENNGSRVLITTRFYEVAKDADPTCEPYKLSFLTEELSRELLLKTTFLNLDPNISSYQDLSYILDQFVRKCSGLPLALVVLGGLLLKTPRNNWHDMLRTMRWSVDGKNCHEIIATSYENLPFALKLCFLYFAAFPEDYNIHAPSLLQMWIAERFIPHEDNRTLEETAESFLEDLVQRSMVQVKSRDFNGSIKYIHIHDLLRDLALEKAKEDNFLVVYSNSNDQTSLGRARRVAIHSSPDCDQLLMSQNLRTLLCFNNTKMPNCSNQRLLKVVRTGDKTERHLELEMFEGLTQLRYLKLTGTLSKKCNEEYLKKAIVGMKFMETLDVEDLLRWDIVPDDEEGYGAFRAAVNLPDCAWHINTLRHVIQSPIYEPTLGPPPSAKLINLHTLSGMLIRESWKTELPYLPNLRTLCLAHESSSWEVVFNFLATLKHLISLQIKNYYPLPSNILDMSNFPFYQHLKSLALVTIPSKRNEMALHKDMFPRYLTHLQIDGHKFQQDLMPVLEKLCWLKNLILITACENKKMSCSSTGFSQLEFLILRDLSMKEWEIEKGAMPILKHLEISSCCKLGVPHGLKYLTNLQQLSCWSLHSLDSIDSIRNLCRHVPSLNFGDMYN